MSHCGEVNKVLADNHRILEYEEKMLLRGNDAKDWFYKGEGAANLVLGYCGSFPALVGKVLRIQKTENAKSLPSSGCFVLSNHERLLWQDVRELAESTSEYVAYRAFVEHFMSKLLSSKHADPGIIVHVSTEFLEAVERNINCLRPTWRINASSIDKLRESAFLIPDHSIITGTPKCDFCIAVEIKPKCGFIPSSQYILEANSFKKHVTRFKMHQFLKLHQGEISQVSGYDPLDLFSGSRERILLAVTDLLASPQNNFRVFMNGSLVFGGLGGGVDNTSHITELALADLFAACGLQLASFLELLVEIILKSGVLDRLLKTQKLDVLDIEGAIHVYYNIISQPCLACKKISNAELLQRYSFLHSLPLEKSLKFTRDYLIAATAKDCSLMMCFRPTKDECTASDYDSVFLRSSKKSYEYKANFIDLDLKPLKKMVHYYELDQKIVDFYRMNREIEGKSCSSNGGSPAESLKLNS